MILTSIDYLDSIKWTQEAWELRVSAMVMHHNNTFVDGHYKIHNDQTNTTINITNIGIMVNTNNNVPLYHLFTLVNNEIKFICLNFDTGEMAIHHSNISEYISQNQIDLLTNYNMANCINGEKMFIYPINTFINAFLI